MFNLVVLNDLNVDHQILLLYINDLPHCLSKTKPRLFADDTNLTASANFMTDLEAAVNSDLENLRK